MTMNDLVKVQVEWSAEKLARLPASGSYSTVARFSGDCDWPNGEAWSIVLLLPPAGDMQDGPFEAEARFLVPEAPAGCFEPGMVFELFEGSAKTATVVVMTTCDR